MSAFSGGLPVSPERKRLLGNPGKRALPPLRVVEPSAEALPGPLRPLGRHGKAAWARLWEAAAWLSPRADVEMLTRLCEAYDERAALRARIKRDGLMSTGSTGQTVVHPAVSAVRILERQMTQWESLCGFTPSDRTRLGIAEMTRQSKLTEFLSSQP